MLIKHRFASFVPDDPQSAADGEVLPSHWNDAHEMQVEPVSLVGNDGGVLAPAKAISVGSGLSLSAGVLSTLGIPVFFQPTQPTETGPYLWIQTIGNDLTAWVNDGAA